MPRSQTELATRDHKELKESERTDTDGLIRKLESGLWFELCVLRAFVVND
jgi:hypothetical protein